MHSQTIMTRGKQQRYCGEGRQERGQFIVHDKLSKNFKKITIRAISKFHQFISNNKKVIQIFMILGFNRVFFIYKIHENLVKISKKSNFFYYIIRS